MKMLGYSMPRDDNATDIQNAYGDASTKLEFSSGNLQYVGKAYPATLSSSAAWQLKKLSYDSSDQLTSVLLANGTYHYDKVWDDRSTYSYL